MIWKEFLILEFQHRIPEADEEPVFDMDVIREKGGDTNPFYATFRDYSNALIAVPIDPEAFKNITAGVHDPDLRVQYIDRYKEQHTAEERVSWYQRHHLNINAGVILGSSVWAIAGGVWGLLWLPSWSGIALFSSAGVATVVGVGGTAWLCFCRHKKYGWAQGVAEPAERRALVCKKQTQEVAESLVFYQQGPVPTLNLNEEER